MPKDRNELPRHSSRNVQVAYHRFTILKADDHIVALHILPDPRFGWRGVNFRWYHRADGSNEFFRPSPKESDRDADELQFQHLQRSTSALEFREGNELHCGCPLKE